MSEGYQVTAGAALTIDVTLRDSNGAIVTDYDGSQALSTSVWAGGERSTSFAATTTWVVPASGTISIAIDDDDTADLEPGRYQLLTRLDDAGTTVDVYRCSIDILEAPGTGTAPFSYITADKMREFAPEIGRLLDEADETNFAEQLNQASLEFDRLVLNRYCPQIGRSRRYTSLDGTTSGAYLRFAPGPEDADAPTRDDLASWLGTPAVVVSADVAECLAHLALSIIYSGEAGRDNLYRQTGGSERALAAACFRGVYLEVDTDLLDVGDRPTDRVRGRFHQDITWLV